MSHVNGQLNDDATGGAADARPFVRESLIARVVRDLVCRVRRPEAQLRLSDCRGEIPLAGWQAAAWGMSRWRQHPLREVPAGSARHPRAVHLTRDRAGGHCWSGR